MKILYIVPFVPWEVRVRSFNLIPRLARRHEITLVCVSGTPPNAKQLERLNSFCRRVVHVNQNTLRAFVRCLAALPTRTPLRISYCASQTAKEAVGRIYRETEPDVVYVERWRALQFVPEDRTAPLVADPTDSMTLYNQRLLKAGTWWERLVGWEEYRKFVRYEGTLARQADVSVFCSRRDMETAMQQAPEARCELVANGVDCEKFSFKDESEEKGQTLVFAGSFKYRPNCHGAKFFLNRVFPLIRQRVPEARFVAVGNEADVRLRKYQGKAGFTAVGFVDDLRPHLANATVAVAPLTVGAGVSNKLLEGFAVGTPVVATPLACGDLPVISGEHLLIGHDARTFAEHAVRLLQDRRLRREMALRARYLVQRHYDWETVSRRMESVLEDSVASSTRANSAVFAAG